MATRIRWSPQGTKANRRLGWDGPSWLPGTVTAPAQRHPEVRTMLTEAQRSPVRSSVFKSQQYFSLWGSSLKVCVCVCVHACVHRNPSVTLLESSFHLFLLRAKQAGHWSEGSPGPGSIWVLSLTCYGGQGTFSHFFALFSLLC